jgi:hypothetical protein
MADLKEHHVKLCFKQGINDMETFKMLKVAFREQKMGKTQVNEWFFKFKSGTTSAEEAKHAGNVSRKTKENAD